MQQHVHSLWAPIDVSNDPAAMRNVAPMLTPQQVRDAAPEPIDYKRYWLLATGRNADLTGRINRLRARLAWRTAAAVVLGFLAAIGWLHIVLSFGVGEGWW